MYYYFYFFPLILLCAAFSGWASNKVKTTYRAFRSVSTSSRMTGYDAAVRLLDSVAAEMNRRKTLLGSSDSDMTIDEYNAENGITYSTPHS